MIEYLTGTAQAGDEGNLILCCGSIAYSLNCSAQTLNELCISKDPVKVYTYLAASENGIALYGFIDKHEREMFYRLTSVSKVGPKAALSILSLFRANELVMVITSGDAQALSRANGIGKKLAESIVFNLRDKLSAFEPGDAADILYGSETGHDAKSEAVLALVSLGFDSASGTRMINACYEEGLSCEELISRALIQLGS